MSDATPETLSADDLSAIKQIAAVLSAAGADLWYDATDPGLTNAVRAALRQYAALEDGANRDRLDALSAAYARAVAELG